MSTTVRVSDQTHDRLVTLAGATGRHMQTIIEEAVAGYEANVFWNSFNAGYERLAGGGELWSQVQAERTGEGPALADGLDGV